MARDTVHAMRRAALALALVLALGLAAAALALRHSTGHAQGTMTARVLLAGGPCEQHAAACARLAHGGNVVVFGPVVEGSASYPRHLLRLNAADSRVRLRLDPGMYAFAFFIRPPWTTLLPNFDDGGFQIVAGRTTDLGLVEPSANWVVGGD